LGSEIETICLEHEGDVQLKSPIQKFTPCTSVSSSLHFHSSASPDL